MNKSIVLLFGFIVLEAAAQNADIKVSYDAYFQRVDNGKSDEKNQYVLLANATESKFYSPMTEYIDSLKSTPKGASMLKNQTETSVHAGKFEAMPQRDGSYYIMKSFNDNNMRCYDSTSLELFYYDETSDGWEWEISDSTKNVLGYECIKATSDYHGRKWEAWFSLEIPINNGPWKLHGLPGLILEASADGGKYSFRATGLEQTSKPIRPVFNAEAYEKTDRISFLKVKSSSIKNPAGMINAQLGVAIPREVQERMFKCDPSFDLIETDYH
ncbi:MAG: GLPGLI family protein [Muribaculaceae bacterium]|nr:GLPGLI family protein [Muribaculaceae bacterium]